MSNVKHTSTPWKTDIESASFTRPFLILPHDVMETEYPLQKEFRIAEAYDPEDARFIVHAVNLHEELVTALTQLVEWMDVSKLSHVPGDGTEYSVVRAARAALMKAKEA